MCSKRSVSLSEVEEEDEEDPTLNTEHNQKSQFQVQIIVTPTQGCDGGAEIRVMGGTPRNNRKLPPIHTQDSKSWSFESPSSHHAYNYNMTNGHGLGSVRGSKCSSYRNIGRKFDDMILQRPIIIHH